MKIRHALHAIAHALRRQPECVRALCKLLPAPPVLSPDERYPFASPDHTGWMAIPRVAHRIRASESAAPVSAGWAYCKWRHFMAHVLVVGWPRLSKTLIIRKSGLAGTGHETVPLDCPPEGSSKGSNDALLAFVAALSRYVDELDVPAMIAKARGYPRTDSVEFKCPDQSRNGETL